MSRHIFHEGDHVLILDRRGRRYLLRLDKSQDFHSHVGNFSHADLIGKEEGTRILNSKGHVLLAVKPTMVDFTTQMPRIATVVYPKDLGTIITLGDIFPGAKVLEAGTGSGALTIALARAVGPKGHLISYDLRTDMIERAKANVTAILEDQSCLTFKLGDVYEGFDEVYLDRVILDLPEPWKVVSHAFKSLIPGGIFLSFLPNILQVHDLTVELKSHDSFDMIETVEVLLRPWSLEGRRVRPAQRMVGHTGFITTARKCSPHPFAK